MKQFAIIGLGNFGFYLATRLYEKGHEVLAIDIDPKRVHDIRDHVNRAVVADATDRETMEALGLKDMDAVVVSIGSHLSNSILATLVMKDIGVNYILAKAHSEPHGRALEKIGALEVLFPERDLALTLAERLDNPNMLDYLPFMEGYSIVQFAPPREFIGKALYELDLINRYGIQVLAVRELVPERMNMIPTGKFVVKDSDILVLLGPKEALDKIKKKTAPA